MRVALPYSDSYPYVTVMVVTPKGDCTVTVDRMLTPIADVRLPVGVEEDEVDVYVCFLDASQQVPYGVGPVLLKAATRQTPSAVESASAVEPAPVIPVQEPEPVLESEPVPVEATPAVEPAA